MPNESRNGFFARYRSALGLVAALVVVALLVLVYRWTAPANEQTTTATGGQVPEGDVLRVGALPVT
jgi:hypothetical protein